jgi:hypothetical protein
MVRPDFSTWLAAQVARDDAVGALARVVAGLEQRRGQPFRDLVLLYVTVRRHGGPIALRSFDIALAEWRVLHLPVRRVRSRLPTMPDQRGPGPVLKAAGDTR